MVNRINIVGKRVLSKPEELKLETEAGIQLVLDEKLERHAQVTGVVVDYGHLAWKDYSRDEWNEPWVQVGNRVMYSKYAGKIITDPDTGEEYVIINDEDVLAIIADDISIEDDEE